MGRRPTGQPVSPVEDPDKRRNGGNEPITANDILALKEWLLREIRRRQDPLRHRQINTLDVRELSARKIRAGTITGQEIIIAGGTEGILRSDNFSSGSSGWRVRGDGSAEFQNITARGDIVASEILVGDPSGSRVHIESTEGLRFFDSAENVVVHLDINTGDATFEGRVEASEVIASNFRTSETGQRLEIKPVTGIEMYNVTGTQGDDLTALSWYEDTTDKIATLYGWHNTSGNIRWAVLQLTRNSSTETGNVLFNLVDPDGTGRVALQMVGENGTSSLISSIEQDSTRLEQKFDRLDWSVGGVTSMSFRDDELVADRIDIRSEDDERLLLIDRANMADLDSSGLTIGFNIGGSFTFRRLRVDAADSHATGQRAVYVNN